MFIIYTLGIRLYGLCIKVVSVFNTKASCLINGRKAQSNKVSNLIDHWPNNARRIWIHAASYGEYEMAKPLIALLEKNPLNHFIISFHSPSGYENIKLDNLRFLKIYLPLDTYSKQDKMVNELQPSCVVFIKYEFWYNLLRVLKDQKIPYFYTSLHLNADSYILKPWAQPFKKLLQNSRRIYCHNSLSLKILESKNFHNCITMGDTRMEQVLMNAQVSNRVVVWQDEQPTVAIGSATDLESKMIADWVSESEYNFLLAPHDVDDRSLSVYNPDENWDRYSTYTSQPSKRIIVDTLGDLKYLYNNCDVAYVGAGFEKGPHNVLEPLVYGIPVVCGSNITKFPMAQYLQTEGLLKVINKLSDLPQAVSQLNQIDKKQFAAKAKTFFDNNSSKIELIVDEISNITT